ncbi:MAG: hypothetical protein V4576_00425 [Patescibacteria group bacterium]
MSIESGPGNKNCVYKAKILTAEEYVNLPYIREKALGHVFKLEKGNKKLFYVGTMHTNKPENPLFREIKNEFNTLQPEIVMLEGRRYINTEKENYRNYYKDKTLEETIGEGEPTFTLKLAVDAGIDFESPEPSQRKEIQHLVDLGYSQVDIHRYYAYRNIYQFLRENSPSTISACKEYVQKFMVNFRIRSGWNEELLNELDANILAEIGTGDNKRFSIGSDPTPWPGEEYPITGQIAAASGQFRDEYMVEEVIRALQKYDKVFIVYGAYHALVQEPALRAYFDDME